MALKEEDAFDRMTSASSEPDSSPVDRSGRSHIQGTPLREYTQTLNQWLNWYYSYNMLSFVRQMTSMNSPVFPSFGFNHPYYSSFGTIRGNNIYYPDNVQFDTNHNLNQAYNVDDPNAHLHRRIIQHAHPPAAGGHIIFQRQPDVILQRHQQSNIGFTEYIIPPVWKRFVAEIIDFFILFYIKLMASIFIIRHAGIIDIEQYEIEDIYKYLFLSPEEISYDKALALTTEILILEVINRIFITLVETMCLYKGIGATVGATPGKRMMKMLVVSCNDVMPAANGRVSVQPAGNVSFTSALVRSVIKNFTMAFFFPACLTMFFLPHNRAVYDIVAGTIVVQPLQNNEQR